MTGCGRDFLSRATESGEEVPTRRPSLALQDEHREPEDEGDAVRALRFVAVTIGALVVGYLVAMFLYLTVGPLLVGA